MLYELLRCLKAFSTSEVGKQALREAFPRPFPALSALLFSEKKPGDLGSRQIIVEMWLFLFDLFPQQSQAGAGTVRFDRAPINTTETVRGLLIPEADDPSKNHHSFITATHRPRIFKAWVQELSDICRDYFWCVFCANDETKLMTGSCAMVRTLCGLWTKWKSHWLSGPLRQEEPLVVSNLRR